MGSGHRRWQAERGAKAEYLRDAELQHAKAAGWAQVDIIKTSDISRETVRRSLRPDIKDPLKQRDAEYCTARKARQGPDN